MIQILPDILSQMSLICSVMLATICMLKHFYIYPELKKMNEENFIVLHKHVSKATLTIFLPLMTIETLSYFSMLRLENTFESNKWLLAAFLLIILWVINFIFSLKIHSKLNSRKHIKLLSELSLFNLFSFFLWISKSVIFYFYFG